MNDPNQAPSANPQAAHVSALPPADFDGDAADDLADMKRPARPHVSKLTAILKDSTLSVEEKKKRIAEFQKERRIEVERQETEAAARRERERIEQNRAQLDLVRNSQDRESQRVIAAAQREKEAAKQRHRVIMAKIELAKRDRHSSSQSASATAAASSNSSQTAATPTQSLTAVLPESTMPSASVPESFAVRIRLSDGRVRILNCTPAEQLTSLVERLRQPDEQSAECELSPSFVLHQNYPRRAFDLSHATATLLELNLVPSGNIFVVPANLDSPSAFCFSESALPSATPASDARQRRRVESCTTRAIAMVGRVFCCRGGAARADESLLLGPILPAGVPLGRTKSQSAATSALLSNPTPRTSSLSDLATAAAARDPHHRDNGNNITFEDKSD